MIVSSENEAISNIQWLKTYHLATTSTGTSQNLSRQSNLALLVGEVTTNKIVHSKLDGLLGRDAYQLRQDTRVQSTETLVAEDLLEAVNGVLVQALTGLSASLVLETSLDQIDRVDHEGTKGTSKTTQSKVVSRFGNLAQDGLASLACLLGGGIRSSFGGVERNAPRRVEDLGKVNKAQATRGLIETGKVEKNIGLHGSKQREARDSGSLNQELGASNLAIRAARNGAAHNLLNQIHLLNHVLEGAHVCVGDLASHRDVAESVKVGEQVVGKLVLGGLEDDALKLLRFNVAVAVLIEELESLADALALQTAQHLGELRVVEVVALLLAANVELGPFAVPVEGNVVGALVELVETAEIIVLDVAGAVDVKQSKGDFVLGVGFGEEVLKDGPIGEVDSSCALAIGNVEEDSVLVALDFVLHKRSSISNCDTPQVNFSNSQSPRR